MGVWGMAEKREPVGEPGIPGPRVAPSDAYVQGDLRATKGWRQPDKLSSPLYVVVPVFNAWRWKTRWKLASRAIKHFMESGAVVYVIEAAFGNREHSLDEVA